MATDPSTHLFWITSRAAGTTALVLSSTTVSMGLALGIKVGASAKRAAVSSPERRSIHESLALATIVAIAVHGLSLIGDSYLHPSILDVTVPFVSSYRTLETSLGILAGWGLLLFGLSFYLRRRIGVGRWRMIHRLTVIAWLAGLAHTFTEGTDAGQPWFIALVLLPIVAASALLAARGVPHLRSRAQPAPAVGLRARATATQGG
jgi:methionine sulfoxide reductase heme-binding subunit